MSKEKGNAMFGPLKKASHTVPIRMIGGPLGGTFVNVDKLPPEKWLVGQRHTFVYVRGEELDYHFSYGKSIEQTAKMTN